MSPPLAQSWGGTCPLQTTKQAKNLAFGGEILLPIPPKRGGNTQICTRSPPNSQDFSSLQAWGGSGPKSWGGNDEISPPIIGGEDPPQFPPPNLTETSICRIIFASVPPYWGGRGTMLCPPYNIMNSYFGWGWLAIGFQN